MSRHALIGIAAASVLAAAAGASAQEAPDAERTRAEFKQLAARMPYLSMSWVIYDRPDRVDFPDDQPARDEHARLLAAATDRAHPKDALLALLRHDDPRVRTLAAVALFDREDPSVLPALVELCGDEAATFDGSRPLVTSGLPPAFREPPPERPRQTVGGVARAMVEFYMRPSGYHYGVEHPTEPGFAAYWEARRNRTHCAGWFAVQLDRATRGTSPMRAERLDRIGALRRRIDALPADDRAWTLLWLRGAHSGSDLVAEAKLIEACRTLGPDKLLLMLQNRIPSDDPDVQPRPSNNYRYMQMVHFVLSHAEQLLRPEQGGALLACERWHRDHLKHGITDPMISPMWAVAAARLNPKEAPVILRAALERFQRRFDGRSRATLCAALWQLAGRPHMEFLAEWFYREPSEQRGPHGIFIGEVGRDPGGKPMIARLIADRRLDDLDWYSLECLVRVVSGWREIPLVSEEEFRKAWHPLGQGHFDWSQAEAERKYPEQTAQLRAVLDEWRRRLRATLPTN